MRRILSGGRAPIALAVVLAVLAGGSAYALASGRTRTITVCVKHRDGVLFQSRRCPGSDRRLTWNTAGPEGATGQSGGLEASAIPAYATAGNAQTTPKTIATVGPITLSETCNPDPNTTGDLDESLYAKSSGASWMVEGFADSDTGAGQLSLNGSSTAVGLGQQEYSTSGDATDYDLYFTVGAVVYHVTLDLSGQVSSDGSQVVSCDGVGTWYPAS